MSRTRVAGRPGIGFGAALAASFGGPPEAPDWPQLPRDRTRLAHQGRTAISLGCSLLPLRPGDEILVPSYNCGTEVEALLAAGLAVVLYRVDERGFLDAEDLRRRVTGRTRALYVTHFFGWPQDRAAVAGICREGGLLLVEDCALSLFSAAGDDPLGRDADLAVFSFPKTLAVPDGGALVLRGRPDPESPCLTPPSRARIFRRTLGLVGRRIAARTGLRRGPRRAREVPPTDGRPDMPADYYWDAATGRWSVSRVTVRLLAAVDPASVVARRRANYERLREGLDGVPGIEPLFGAAPRGVCPLEFPVRVVAKDRWIAALAGRGIPAIPWWSGYHRALPWDDFPEACRLKDQVLALPVHQDLDGAAMDHVARQVADVAARLRP